MPRVVVDSHPVHFALQEAMEEQQKARIEQRKRMEVTIKRMDHLERARREVEAPLLQEQYAESLKVGLSRPTTFTVLQCGSPPAPGAVCWGREVAPHAVGCKGQPGWGRAGSETAWQLACC